MLNKVITAVELEESEEESTQTTKTKVKRSNKLFLQGPSKPKVLPFPIEFQNVLGMEWAHPTLLKCKPKVWHKLYSLSDSDSYSAFHRPTCGGTSFYSSDFLCVGWWA